MLMLPVPRRGILRRVDGVPAAREVPGIEGIEITATLGAEVLPLPEGRRYLGFVFARRATAPPRWRRRSGPPGPTWSR